MSMRYRFAESFEPPEAGTIAYCSRCKGEIYEGEEFGTDGMRVICSDCVGNEFGELPLWAKFQLLGLDIKGG
jgi:hypothetical protein